MRGVREVLGVLGVLGVLTPLAAWAPEREARRRPHEPVTTKVTFEREIRAILEARCAGCHAPGAPAPMPLMTYAEVRPWAGAIKDQILTRRMPIWHAAHGYGIFANDPGLTPIEMALIVSWVDGGQPRGVPTGQTPAVRRLAPRGEASAIVIAASASNATVQLPSAWIGGWDFEPGDPLIASVTLTAANGAAIGTWVAGDGPLVLPPGTGVRAVSPIDLRIERRKPADYEKPFTPKRSMLRVRPLADVPARRAWVEETACGAPRTGRNAAVIAVRPLLADGASARIWLERPGAPRTIVGWFRNADARYLRTYWLARPIDLSAESRVQADVPCRIELTLRSGGCSKCAPTAPHFSAARQD